MDNTVILAVVLTVVILGVIAFFAIRTKGTGKKFLVITHIFVGILVTALVLYPWPGVATDNYLARILVLLLCYGLLYLHFRLQEYEP